MRRESSFEEITDWSDDSTRRHFISKVCSILAMQLFLTGAITSAFLFIEDARDWLQEHRYVFFIAIGFALILSFVIICCQSVARTVPINYILLFAYTFFESIIVSFICMKFQPMQILTALGVTVLVCFTLALFALIAPCDFTGCGPFIFVAVLVLLVMSIAAIFIGGRTIIWIVCCAGVLIFSFALIYDVQLMVGGNHKNQYNEEDYVVAALSLYVDIIMIFIYILQIIGLLDS